MLKRKLPTGVSAFQSWSFRIIKKAMLPASVESQRFALANMLLALPTTTDKERDSYFVAALRKSAVNQVAEGMRETLRNAAKARLEAEAKRKEAHDKVLEAASVPSASG